MKLWMLIVMTMFFVTTVVLMNTPMPVRKKTPYWLFMVVWLMWLISVFGMAAIVVIGWFNWESAS